MDFSTPANTTAQVILPQPETEEFKVMMNGKELKAMRNQENLIIEEVVPGEHRIKIKLDYK
jgi:hypothetical protein